MIATPVTLRIFFYGLIAFTPDEFVSGGFMRAILIDAQNPPAASDGCALHAHKPALLYYDSAGTCSDECPPRHDGLCECSLAGRYLLDIPSLSGNTCPRPADPPEPGGSGNGDDFDLIPKMSSLRLFDFLFRSSRLHPDCDQPCPTRDQPICRLVEAQVNFLPSQAKACTTVHSPFSFRPLGSSNLYKPSRPAMSEIIAFETTTTTTDLSFLTLELSQFGQQGTIFIDVPIIKKGDTYTADIAATNTIDFAAHEHSSGRCRTNLIARDFELFHDLSASPQSLLDRAVPQTHSPPQLKYDHSALCSDSHLLDAIYADILHAGNARPICPEASF